MKLNCKKNEFISVYDFIQNKYPKQFHEKTIIVSVNFVNNESTGNCISSCVFKNIDKINYYKQIIDENITRDALHISEIPKYIENYFYDIVKELDKKDKNIINDIKIKLSNKELFFEDIKIYLEQAIYNFNNYEDEENDIDF